MKARRCLLATVLLGGLAAACSAKSAVATVDGGAVDAGRRADSGRDAPTALERCIATCEAEMPAATAALNSVFDCAFAQCAACEPAAAPADASAGASDAGGCPRVGRAPGEFSMQQGAACDACVGERCCDKVTACLASAPCASLNACEDRCVAANR